MVDKEALEMIMEWGNNPDKLHNDLLVKNPSLYYQLSEGMINVIKELQAHTSLIATSSETFEGMDDLYTTIQQIFYGGEDLEKK